MSDATSTTMDHPESSISIPFRIRNPLGLPLSLLNINEPTTSTALVPRLSTPPPQHAAKSNIDTTNLQRTTLLKTYPLNSSDTPQRCRICTTNPAQQLLHYTVSYLHPTTAITQDSLFPVCNTFACEKEASVRCVSEIGERREGEERRCAGCGARSRGGLCGGCTLSRELFFDIGLKVRVGWKFG